MNEIVLFALILLPFQNLIARSPPTLYTTATTSTSIHVITLYVSWNDAFAIFFSFF